MKPFSDYMGEKLLFIQPSFFKGLHELRINDELLATIQSKGFFGMRWEVSIQNKNWEIYNPSFWRTALDIREIGYELPIANFVSGRFRSKGVVSLPKGEILKIEPHHFKGFTEIKNVKEECIVRIKSKISLKEKDEAIIEKRSELIDRYPWVILLAYIIIIYQRHRASHSVV